MAFAFQVSSWLVRCSTDVDNSNAVTSVFVVQLHPVHSSVCRPNSGDNCLQNRERGGGGKGGRGSRSEESHDFLGESDDRKAVRHCLFCLLVAKPVLLSGICRQSVAGLDVGSKQLLSRQRHDWQMLLMPILIIQCHAEQGCFTDNSYSLSTLQ